MGENKYSIREKTLQEMRMALRALDEKKAEAVKVLDVRKKSSITDYLILAGATSEPHVKALKSELDKSLKAGGVNLIGEDREVGSGWLVVDAFDFMVHLQTEKIRQFYGLDALWKDAPELDLMLI